MLHNENSRAKTPALVYFARLGYEYFHQSFHKVPPSRLAAP